jgi:hypothetical protein
MPIQITERLVPDFPVNVDVPLVTANAVKIIEVNINVNAKSIMITLQWGMIDATGSFTPYQSSKTVVITENEFLEIAQLKVEQNEVGMTAYDWIAKKLYDWLVAKGKV